MGFKKGRAARAAAAVMTDGPTEDSLHLRHEDTGVVAESESEREREGESATANAAAS